MVSSPLVSVIVPCYNHAAYVTAALNSVKTQTYPDIELIILDDASKDSSVYEIERLLDTPVFSKRFNGKLRFEKKHRNQGAHATINEGVQLSQGEIIAILNSDDRFHPERITTIIKTLLETGSAFGFSRVSCLTASHDPAALLGEEPLIFQRAQHNIAQFPSVGFALFASQCAVSSGNFVFTRELYQKLGGFSSLLYCHDWDFALQALLHTEPVYVPETLYYYRLHNGNSFRALSHRAEEETHIVITRFLREVYQRRYANDRTPSPWNWPSVFELFLENYGYGKYWEGAKESPLLRVA